MSASTAAPRPFCTVTRCPHRQPCPAHLAPAQEGWANRAGTNVQRVRGRRLQALRAALFQREPLCRVCRAEGRTTIATIRDHITPLAEGDEDIERNIQPLCADCSRGKTQRESARGVTRHV